MKRMFIFLFLLSVSAYSVDRESVIDELQGYFMDARECNSIAEHYNLNVTQFTFIAEIPKNVFTKTPTKAVIFISTEDSETIYKDAQIPAVVHEYANSYVIQAPGYHVMSFIPDNKYTARVRVYSSDSELLETRKTWFNHTSTHVRLHIEPLGSDDGNDDDIIDDCIGIPEWSATTQWETYKTIYHWTYKNALWRCIMPEWGYLAPDNEFVFGSWVKIMDCQ